MRTGSTKMMVTEDLRNRDRQAVSDRQVERDALRAVIAQMGGMAEAALARALEALQRHDVAGAEAVVAGDKAIDAAERHAEAMVAALIGLVAADPDGLREVLAAHRIVGLIERVGDYAKTVAKRMPEAEVGSPAEPMRLIGNLGDGVRELLRQALDAFAARDATAAALVCTRDREVDKLYQALVRALLAQMMAAPLEVPAYSQLLFIAKSLERVGDQATNIAELVYYAATGEQLPDRHG